MGGVAGSMHTWVFPPPACLKNALLSLQPPPPPTPQQPQEVGKLKAREGSFGFPQQRACDEHTSRFPDYRAEADPACIGNHSKQLVSVVMVIMKLVMILLMMTAMMMTG